MKCSVDDVVRDCTNHHRRQLAAAEVQASNTSGSERNVGGMALHVMCPTVGH